MRRTALFLFVFIVLISCGKKEVKPVSQESKISQEAFALAEKVRDAFIKNDRATLQQISTEKGYRDVTASSKSFETVELIFTPRWVEIEPNQNVMMNVTWKSTWTSAGKKLEDRGMAVFAMEGRPLKLAGILRANPFIFPEQ